MQRRIGVLAVLSLAYLAAMPFVIAGAAAGIADVTVLDPGPAGGVGLGAAAVALGALVGAPLVGRGG